MNDRQQFIINMLSTIGYFSAIRVAEVLPMVFYAMLVTLMICFAFICLYMLLKSWLEQLCWMSMENYFCIGAES